MISSIYTALCDFANSEGNRLIENASSDKETDLDIGQDKAFSIFSISCFMVY